MTGISLAWLTTPVPDLGPVVVRGPSLEVNALWACAPSPVDRGVVVSLVFVGPEICAPAWR